MTDLSTKPLKDANDEDLERLMEVDSNVKALVNEERKNKSKKILLWLIIIFCLIIFFLLEYTNKTNVFKKLHPYITVKTPASSNEGSVVPLSLNNPPLLIQKSELDKNLPEKLPIDSKDDYSVSEQTK